ncbi:hypothetical protein D0Z00_000187 [Geotrichum galactomycetum]|uniref:Uncharacterized protein n=1 Tax=Geotrichum galactomycetum TaxID=27317 RepID=A0ACB6VAU0_9ASCO|nr:hypothetical protein D0Z00_000187 [Geotrichum candidum]
MRALAQTRATNFTREPLDFNPKTLKVPELRRIFVFHSVSFPSSAKKSDLIEIFNREIATRAAQLKADFVNVAPEGKDIIKVPAAVPVQSTIEQTLSSSASSNKFVEADSETTASVKSKKTKSRAENPASSSVTTAEPEDIEFSEYIHEEKITIENSVVVIADSDDEVNTPEADSKKRPLEDETAEPLRKKQELEGDVEKEPVQTDSTSSAATSITPLQQEPPRTPAKQHANHASFHRPATSFKEEKYSSVRKQQPSSVGTGAGRRIKARESSASPVAAITKKEPGLAKLPDSPAKVKDEPKEESKLTAAGSDSEEAETEISSAENESDGEIKKENTSEEEQEESEAASVIGQVLEGLLLILVVISLAFTARWFTAEQFKAGYCGVTEAPRSIQQWYYNPPQVWQDYVAKDYIVGRAQQFIDEIRPQCVECPEHAVCSDGFRSECEPGYVKVESILSVGGYLPVPPYCKLDTSREDRFNKLKKKALEILRERNGRVICGTNIDSKIEASELRKLLFDLEKDTIDQAEFDDLWNNILIDIESESDITIHYSQPASRGDGKGQEKPESSVITTSRALTLQSTSESQLTLACKVHRAVANGLARYGFELRCLLVFVMLFRIIYTVLTTRARRHARLERLADRVVERLRQQIFEAEDDLSGLTMRGVEVTRAKREFFARLQVPLPAAATVFTTPAAVEPAVVAEVEAIWKQIAKLVEQNDLVEVKQAIIYGEIMRVWEYVGTNAGDA